MGLAADASSETPQPLVSRPASSGPGMVWVRSKGPAQMRPALAAAQVPHGDDARRSRGPRAGHRVVPHRRASVGASRPSSELRGTSRRGDGEGLHRAATSPDLGARSRRAARKQAFKRGSTAQGEGWSLVQLFTERVSQKEKQSVFIGSRTPFGELSDAATQPKLSVHQVEERANPGKTQPQGRSRRSSTTTIASIVSSARTVASQDSLGFSDQSSSDSESSSEEESLGISPRILLKRMESSRGKSLIRTSTVHHVLDTPSSRDQGPGESRMRRSRLSLSTSASGLLNVDGVATRHGAQEAESMQACYLRKCAEFGIEPNTRAVGAVGFDQGDALDFSGFGIGDSMATALADSIGKEVCFQRVLLRDNRLSHKGLCILRHVRLSFLTEIDLSNNPLGVPGAKALAGVLGIAPVHTLSVERCRLGERGVTILANVLRDRKKIRRVNFSRNDFGVGGAVAIGRLLEHVTSIRELNVSWNTIRGRGAVGLANGLRKNEFLEMLDMSWNAFSSGRESHEAARAFGEALADHQHLLHLDLSHNNLDSVDCSLIGNGLRSNHTLVGLHMSGNQGQVDPRGFIEDGAAHPGGEQGVHKQVMTRIVGFNPGLTQDWAPVPDHSCWICEKWSEHQFLWPGPLQHPEDGMSSAARFVAADERPVVRSPSKKPRTRQGQSPPASRAGESPPEKELQVMLHTSVDGWEPELMERRPDGRFQLWRMLPPTKVRYWFTVNGERVHGDTAYGHSVERAQATDDDVVPARVNYVAVQPRAAPLGELRAQYRNAEPRKHNAPGAGEDEEALPLFTKDDSLFTSHCGDTRARLNATFAADWAYSRLGSKFFSCELERDEVANLLCEHYGLLKDTFKAYAQPWSVNWASFVEFAFDIGATHAKPGQAEALRVTNLLGGLSTPRTGVASPGAGTAPTQTPVSKATAKILSNLALDRLFLAVNYSHVSDIKGRRNPARCLTRCQWLDAIVRLATSVFPCQVGDYPIAVRRFLTERLPLARHHEPHVFRRGLYTREIDAVLRSSEEVLGMVFAQYSRQQMLTLEDFQRILGDASLLTQHFTTRDAHTAFVQSVSTVLDEMVSDKFSQLNYVEFLEAVCRTADQGVLFQSSIDSALAHRGGVDGVGLNSTSKQSEKGAAASEEAAAFRARPLHEKLKVIVDHLGVLMFNRHGRRKVWGLRARTKAGVAAAAVAAAVSLGNKAAGAKKMEAESIFHDTRHKDAALGASRSQSAVASGVSLSSRTAGRFRRSRVVVAR